MICLFTLICVNGWWYSASSDSFGGFHEKFSAGKPFRKFDLYMKQSENESLLHVFFPVFSHSLVRFSKKWRFGFELINQPSLLDWHKTGAAIITRNENDLDCRHQTLPGEICLLCLFLGAADTTSSSSTKQTRSIQISDFKTSYFHGNFAACGSSVAESTENISLLICSQINPLPEGESFLQRCFGVRPSRASRHQQADSGEMFSRSLGARPHQ